MPLPRNVVEKTKAHLLDTIAACVSGSRLDPGQKGIEYVTAKGRRRPKPRSSPRIIVTTASNASFANAMLAHADETDDSHKKSRSHIGCSAIPAALAMGEREGASGEALVRAIALGYDVGSRVLFALSPLKFHQAGHCTHSFAGVFGATAAASALARAFAGHRRAGRCHTPLSRRPGSQVGGVRSITSRRRLFSPACPRAMRSRPLPWSRRALPASTMSSAARRISSSRSVRIRTPRFSWTVSASATKYSRRRSRNGRSARRSSRCSMPSAS